MNRSFTLLSAASFSALFFAGCGDTQQEDAAVLDGIPTAETSGTSPQSEMQSGADQLQARLVGHVSRARAAGPAEFRQMWLEHEALVNEMLEDCRQMMRQMDMTPPREFTEVEAGLEEDLARIPTLGDPELASLLPDHLDRVQAVIDMRQEMVDMR